MRTIRLSITSTKSTAMCSVGLQKIDKASKKGKKEKNTKRQSRRWGSEGLSSECPGRTQSRQTTKLNVQ